MGIRFRFGEGVNLLLFPGTEAWKEEVWAVQTRFESRGSPAQPSPRKVWPARALHPPPRKHPKQAAAPPPVFLPACPTDRPTCRWTHAVSDLSPPCSFGLSATSQQYFSLTTNQPPATSQQYSSLRTNQHQPSATSQPNRLHITRRAAGFLFCFRETARPPKPTPSTSRVPVRF
jgi:hypothetical protein